MTLLRAQLLALAGRRHVPASRLGRASGPRRVARLLAASCLLFGLIVAPAGSASAAAACAGASGVTVVVDFGSLGGGIQTRCAAGDPGSGWAALQSAGFTLTSVQRFPGFVCKIDGKPASDPCVNTPPQTAYWAYWHAPRGGSWSYSQEGPSTRDPSPGTVEGWAFGSGGKPGIAPPAAAPPLPPTSPASRPTTAQPPPASLPASPTPTSSPPSALPSPAASSVEVEVEAASPTSVPPKRTNFTGFAAGIGVVLAVAALALHASRRRRRFASPASPASPPPSSSSPSAGEKGAEEKGASE